jgi:ribosomal protein L37AE/L43A
MSDFGADIERLGFKRVYEEMISGPPCCPVCGADKAFQASRSVAHCFDCGTGGSMLTVCKQHMNPWPNLADELSATIERLTKQLDIEDECF